VEDSFAGVDGVLAGMDEKFAGMKPLPCRRGSALDMHRPLAKARPTNIFSPPAEQAA
jgi:hypothetical protein